MKNKMKQWRRPEYKNGELVKQRPFVRRKAKGSINRSENGWMSLLLASMFERVGIVVKNG